MTSRGIASGAAVAAALALSTLVATKAQAQNEDYYGAGYDDQYAPPQGQAQEPPIPPYVEGAPIAAPSGGGYCYVGPHPVDTRVVPGPAFEDVEGQNIRPYPPVDLRLFSYHQGCYYFIGDPRDFGYGGQAYSYYGAHPVLDVYGGGWCFMMGGHNHLWRPWSPYFTVVGPWYYWYGPYDPFFWSYWPYYSFYYRSYYPNYYAGGRFYRGGGYRAAPPISRVPATAMRGRPPGMAAGGSNFRGSPPAGTSPSAAGGWRGSAPASGASSVAPFRSSTPTQPGGSVFRSSPSGGGFSGGWRGGGGRRR